MWDVVQFQDGVLEEGIPTEKKRKIFVCVDVILLNQKKFLIPKL